MSNEPGVNASSPNASPGASPSSAGNPDVNAQGNRSLEQVMKENERKAAEISELREQLEEVKDAQERLEELQNKSKLSKSEEDEMAELHQQIQDIMSDKRSRAWREVGKRDSAVEIESRLAARDKLRAERLMNTWADTEKVDPKKFEQELVAFMRKADPAAELPVDSRAEDGYRLWKAHKAEEAERAENKAKQHQFRESGKQSIPQAPKSHAEALEQAKNDPSAMTRYLKDIHARQEKERAGAA